MSAYPKRIALLGSTGSIGQQTLDIVRCFPEQFQVVALAARSNLDLLAEQVREFRPSLVACFANSAELEQKARALFPNVILGERGLLAVATHADADVLVAATSGLMGLRPTMAAIEAGKTIALANKETLVMAGHIVTEAARRNGVSIVPIDSEHSAIWQCLHGEENNQIRRLILTASGGPFRTTPPEELRDVSVEQALAHPTWRMGPKITIDSATLMNKGLEVIESYWLFDVPYERIEVVVHPESIIHSMVEFCDGSIKMQASLPTMHLPIMHALTYPERLDTADKNLIRELHWPSIAALHFEELNLERFPCFRLALEAGKRGGTYSCALVGADEEAVAMFLEGKIPYQGIAQMLEAVLEQHNSIAQPDVNATLEACAWARRTAREWGEKHLAG
ncbi:1-deoxy-D-xylulose-5-phosphate reductoisomerase [Ktedonobacter racemifer]|uniref:1-deoxy-D-xylulose 5-phosphate reductoisomerase n=1 Tax=Ktedonobacter racemifer DSM 44963 TaxID=485913 RepID=D6TL26_KTERA|nr:1-deoxy-D-xylulose-5-phosphate reductoisomerase [Ktedonobacter racemifer]EFH86476.1 1-deoxy-D-xylulose 5-phosphate reductoisomerase [Ktedonobacter racemifer DSM 44963]